MDPTRLAALWQDKPVLLAMVFCTMRGKLLAVFAVSEVGGV